MPPARSLLLVATLAALGCSAVDDGASGQELGAGPDGAPSDSDSALTIEVFGGGEVTVTDGVSQEVEVCGPSGCTLSLPPGTPLTLDASPAAEFVEWEPQLGAGCSYMSEAGVSARLTITRDCTIYAYFGEPGLPPPPGD